MNYGDDDLTEYDEVLIPTGMTAERLELIADHIDRLTYLITVDTAENVGLYNPNGAMQHHLRDWAVDIADLEFDTDDPKRWDFDAPHLDDRLKCWCHPLWTGIDGLHPGPITSQ